MPASDYQYWLGKETKDLKYVAKRGIPRQDGYDKASGKAQYAGEIKLPGMLYCRMLTCPYAHARIKSMDTSEAEKLPGVRGILRYDDPIVPKRLWTPWDPDFKFVLMSPTWGTPFYILGDEGFHYNAIMGVAVAAEDWDIAEEALHLIKVEWEELPFVVDIPKALEEGAPIAYPFTFENGWEPDKLFVKGWNFTNPDVYSLPYSGTPSNRKVESIFEKPDSDMDAGFAEADKTIDFSFRRTEVGGWSPEPTAFVVNWNQSTGVLEGWAGGEQPIEGIFEYMLGLSEKVGRWSPGKSDFVINYPYVGGQFGGWEMAISSHYSVFCIAALMSKKTGLPVKAGLERKNETTFAEMDEGIYNIKVGFKNDGTITAVEVDTYLSQTADPGNDRIDLLGTGHIYNDTKVQNITCKGTAVSLNKGAFGASRCEQQPPAHVMVHVMYRVADALGMDVADVAQINDGHRGKGKEWLSEFRKTNKLPDIDGLPQVIEKGKTAMDWETKWHAPGTKKLPNGKMHGIACLYGHEFSNGGPPMYLLNHVFKLHLTFDTDKVCIVAHRKDCGVDTATSYHRIVAEETGMLYEDVGYNRFYESQPSLPTTVINGGGGSKLFTLSAWMFVATARLLKQKMLTVAAATLGASVDDLDIVDSKVIYKNGSENPVPVKNISGINGLCARNFDLRSIDAYNAVGIPPHPTEDLYIGRMGNFVEIEVDPNTGQVEILKSVVVNDVGLPIGPETVEGQMYGAMIMGHSNATCEEVVYDPATGVILNPNMIDYKILTLPDIPEVETEMLTNRMGYGCYGCCGVGEDNTTWGSGLMPLAVHNALGVWVDYPTTPERILKALGKG